MEIARIRRFNRAVTSELGALEQDFLGRGRPLGHARVLHAIGSGYSEVRALRQFLGLDSGLMSRILRALEQEDLIETSPNAHDTRQRDVRLTPAGQSECSAYNRLSDDRAASMLSAHRDPDALLAAIDLVASALSRAPLDLAMVDPMEATVRYAMQRYADDVSQHFGRRFDLPPMTADDAAQMQPPKGGVFLAHSDGVPVGCGALRPLQAEIGEIKRLWVCPSMRGQGLAKRIMAALEQTARDLGYRRLRLDSNRRLAEAVTLYQRNGWTEIPRYNDSPDPDVFFEKRL